MSDLVSMILDVSRIQLGRMRIEKQDLDLNVFFHELLATIEPKAVEKKVEFIKHIPEGMPVAQLDRRYTNMTIENLLSNAVKYTPEGGKVTCDVKIANGTVLVTVADTGMGIPQAEQSKIFGRMFRASNARNAIDGNGFGLFVAKGAVEAQGGKIWFESTEGKGTTFYVQLPLKD
jgi:two-component system sensor histidine kinase VicK